MRKPMPYDPEPTRERFLADGSRRKAKLQAYSDYRRELDDSISELRYFVLRAERRKARSEERTQKLITCITYIIYPFYWVYMRAQGK